MAIKVLILEDDRDDAELISELVRQTGFEDLEILTATNMEGAVRVAFSASGPTLILADQNLGNGSGAAFIHIALEQSSKATAVLLTGLAYEALPGEVRLDLAKGTYLYLSKSDLNVDIIRSLIIKARKAADPEHRPEQFGLMDGGMTSTPGQPLAPGNHPRRLS